MRINIHPELAEKLEKYSLIILLLSIVIGTLVVYNRDAFDEQIFDYAFYGQLGLFLIATAVNRYSAWYLKTIKQTRY